MVSGVAAKTILSSKKKNILFITNSLYYLQRYLFFKLLSVIHCVVGTHVEVVNINRERRDRS